MRLRFISLFLILCATHRVAADDELRILSWNIESRGSSSATIEDQLKAMRGYHIVGLTEVSPRDFSRFASAVSMANGSRARYVAGVTGGGARLMIIFDTDRLRLNSYSELFNHNGIQLNNWNHRSPLVANLYDKQTDTELLVVLNHLARRDESFRNHQAKGLREWAKNQTLPLIAIGDYNFDYDFPMMSGNAAFRVFVQDDVWRWIKPVELIDTNWADVDADGRDDFPESMLDFVFVGNEAKDWPADSRVIVRPGDFPDDMQTSDHWPVAVSVEPRR